MQTVLRYGAAMLGRTLIFAASVIALAVFATSRHSPGTGPDGPPSPLASATKKPGFFDPIPRTVVKAASATMIPRGTSGHFFTDATINGHPVQVLIDTGASTVALSVEDARAVGINVDPANFQVIGQGASGPVRGLPIRLDEVEVGGHRVSNVDGAVLEGLEGTLLGQSYLRNLNSVEIRGDTMVLR